MRTQRHIAWTWMCLLTILLGGIEAKDAFAVGNTLWAWTHTFVVIVAATMVTDQVRSGR